MPNNSKRDKKFITGVVFFGIVIVMTLWAVVSSYVGGTLGSTEVFNFDFFGLSQDPEDHSFTTLFTTLIIIAALVLFLVLGVKQWRDDKKTMNHDDQLLESDISEIDEMTQEEFDEYLVVLFKRMGYRSEAVSSPSDPGVDVLLYRDTNDLVVVYAPLSKERIGNEAVDAALDAMKRHKAQAAWIITNSRFEKKTIRYAKDNKLRLVDRKILMNIVDRATRTAIDRLASGR